MDFFTTEARDGLRVIGLHSPAEHQRALVLHVHGYGGDFYSNAFLRACHTAFPIAGIAFVSINLRTAGYVTEVYSEQGVRYVGSAVADHSEAEWDIEATIDALGVPDAELVLQGHSFGTNVVKHYARAHPEVRRMVLLSPADSVALYDDWASTDDPRTRLSVHSSDCVRWDLFGMTVAGAAYPIPISEAGVERLMASGVFREWSGAYESANQTSLVVLGGADPIVAVGNTSSREFFNRVLPNSTVHTIDDARHLFARYEDQLCRAVIQWILETDTDIEPA